MRLVVDLPDARPLTASDFTAIAEPEGVRLELWEGNLVVAPRAQIAWHGMVASQLAGSAAVGGRVAQGVAVILGSHDVAIPDLVVFHHPIADLRRSAFSADEVERVVEIVAPGSTERDNLTKPPKYAAAGIPEFWLVNEDPHDPTGAVVRQHGLIPAGGYVLIRTIGWRWAEGRG